MSPAAKPNPPSPLSLNHTLAGLGLGTSPSSSSVRSTPSPSSDMTGAASEEEDRARALVDLSIALIDAASDVLEGNIQTDEELTKTSVLMPGGTVGKHFRHVIEMFQAFINALAEQEGSSSGLIEIDYDAPSPKSRKAIARSLPACRSAMKGIRDGLLKWEAKSQEGGAGGGKGLASEMQRKVRLVAVTPTKQVMESSVGRELWFCSLHAIHHFSMLRTIAVHELGLSLPTEFGTAPSTLLYRAQDWKPPPERKEVRPAKSKL